jgi:hypothetical protein
LQTVAGAGENPFCYFFYTFLTIGCFATAQELALGFLVTVTVFPFSPSSPSRYFVAITTRDSEDEAPRCTPDARRGAMAHS